MLVERLGSRWISLLAMAWLAQPAALPQPSQAMQEYNRAWQLTGQRRTEEAILLLKRLIIREPAFDRAYEVLAEAYSQRNQFDQAEQYFRSLPGEGRAGALGAYGLGELHSARKQYGAAIGDYSSCIRQRAQTANCYVHLVYALMAHHSTNELALEDLRRRVPYDPGNVFVRLAFATMYRMQRKPGELLQEAQPGLEMARLREDQDLMASFEVLLSEAYRICCDDQPKVLAHLQEALKIYQRLGDWRAQFYLSHNVAIACIRLNDFDQARAYEERRLAWSRELGHRLGVAESLAGMADYYDLRGELDSAVQYYREAIPEFEELRPESVKSLLLTVGRIYMTQGNLKGALDTFEECRRVAVAGGDRRIEAHALRGLGNVCLESGDYFKALQYQTQSVRIFQTLPGDGNRWTAGAGIGNVAKIYAELGDYANARDLYQQSLRSGYEHHDLGEQERNLLNLGRLELRLDHPKETLHYLERRPARVSKPWAASALLAMGEAYSRLRQPQRALSSIQEGLAIAREVQVKSIEAQALNQLGDYYVKTGELARAEMQFSSSLKVAEPSGIAAMVLWARRGLAEALRRRGEYAGSLRQLQTAVETIESMRSRIPSPELRSGFVQENWKIYEDTVYILSLLHRRAPGKGYDRQAFDYAEKGRARSFLDTLSESRAHITKGLTPEQIKRQASLFEELSKASAGLLREASEKNRMAVRKAEQDLSGWALELRQTNPAYQQLRYPAPYGARKVQSAVIRPGTVLLEYALGEHQSQVWGISHEQIRMAVLPGRKDIEKDVLAFRETIRKHPRGDRDLDAHAQQAHRLYKLLLEPIGGLLHAGDTLVIVPDGILYYLPYETLVTNSEARPRYLIENHAVVYAPSATVFANLQQAARSNQDPALSRRELLAYGDPVFALEKTAGAAQTPIGELVRGTYAANGVSFRRLPYTRAEVEGISRLYAAPQRRTYLGRDASESSVKREKLTAYRRVHFATHAVLDEQFPARSGVVLSLVETGGEDGVLHTNEIFNLELKCDLVVLSACQTGLGKLVKGEGMVGLTRAFLYAGAARVVVSLWNVNDLATAEFMKLFYEKMNAGRSPGHALREAKLAMIGSGSPAYRHPYFWAPFVLAGVL